MRESQASHGTGTPVSEGKNIQWKIDFDGAKLASEKGDKVEQQQILRNIGLTLLLIFQFVHYRYFPHVPLF